MKDTLVAGAGLCDERAVEVLVTEGPKYVQRAHRLGTEFDARAESYLYREAARSRRRILHAHGDSTGAPEFVSSLIARACSGGITINLIPFANTERLISTTATAWALSSWIRFSRSHVQDPLPSVIMCTGGAGQLFQHTTNPPVATGDGMAMAYFAGQNGRYGI